MYFQCEETFKLLPFVNHIKRTKCFAGDFMDDQWSSRICVQNLDLLKNFLENAKALFLMKIQITQLKNHLHESSLLNSVGTSLGKQIKYFVLIKSYQE